MIVAAPLSSSTPTTDGFGPNDSPKSGDSHVLPSLSPSSNSRRRLGKTKKSKAQSELHNKVLALAGDQAIQRFGPICVPTDFSKKLSRLPFARLDAYVKIKAEWEEEASIGKGASIGKELLFRAATFSGFEVDSATQLLRRMEPQIWENTAIDLEQNLLRKIVLPVPFLDTLKNEETVYFNPSRFHPKTDSIFTAKSLLIYVMNSIYERFQRRRKMCLIVNLSEWDTTENFTLDSWMQIIDVLQGYTVPMRFNQVLLVNPPENFDRAWEAMRFMCKCGFEKRVRMVSEHDLGEYLPQDYMPFLPNEFATGKASVDDLIVDFLIYRKALEDALHSHNLTSSNHFDDYFESPVPETPTPSSIKPTLTRHASMPRLSPTFALSMPKKQAKPSTKNPRSSKSPMQINLQERSWLNSTPMSPLLPKQKLSCPSTILEGSSKKNSKRSSSPLVFRRFADMLRSPQRESKESCVFSSSKSSRKWRFPGADVAALGTEPETCTNIGVKGQSSPPNATQPKGRRFLERMASLPSLVGSGARKKKNPNDGFGILRDDEEYFLEQMEDPTKDYTEHYGVLTARPMMFRSQSSMQLSVSSSGKCSVVLVSPVSDISQITPFRRRRGSASSLPVMQQQDCDDASLPGSRFKLNRSLSVRDLSTASTIKGETARPRRAGNDQKSLPSAPISLADPLADSTTGTSDVVPIGRIWDPSSTMAAIASTPLPRPKKRNRRGLMRRAMSTPTLM